MGSGSVSVKVNLGGTDLLLIINFFVVLCGTFYKTGRYDAAFAWWIERVLRVGNQAIVFAAQHIVKLLADLMHPHF